MQQTYKENTDKEIFSEKEKKQQKAFLSKSLSLQRQGLTDAWWNAVTPKETVEILILDENCFTEIPRNVLKEKFPQLKLLSIKKNRIEKLSIEALSHPMLEILDLQGNTSLCSLELSANGTGIIREKVYNNQINNNNERIERIEKIEHLSMLNLLETNIEYIEREFFLHLPALENLKMHIENICGGCEFGFLQSLEQLRILQMTGVRTSSCSTCKLEKSITGFSSGVKNSIYNIVCRMTQLKELDLSGKNMSIDHFVFLSPLPYLESLRMQGRLVRDMSLRDWPGILKTIKHLSLGVVDDTDETKVQKMYNESTFYAERILEATNLVSLSFDSITTRRIKFSLGTKKVIFPYLTHLTIKNCDLRPLTFFNKENAPSLNSLEITSMSFTEGYFYTIKKRLGNRLRHLRIGIEKMDAPQAIYDLFTFIRSHKSLESLHLSVCDTIMESQSFYKYFSDHPRLQELYICGKMNNYRMKRFLHQLGHITTLKVLLLDIEEPSVVMLHFCPIPELRFFSLKSTYAVNPKFPIPISQQSLEKIGTMKSLEVLDLSGCGIEALPANLIPNLQQLTHLYLDNNRISFLPDKMISALRMEKKVVYVDISKNFLDRETIEDTLINECWLGRSGFILL